MVGDGLSQRDAPRPFKSLPYRHRPGTAFTGRTFTCCPLVTDRGGEFRIGPRPRGAGAAFGGGNLSTPFTNLVTLTSSNRVISGSPNSLSFNLTLANGTFTGSVKVPDVRTNSFKGALLQDLNAGYGYFLGTNQSGSLLLQAP